LVAFNAYVQSQLDGLAARGQVTMDLVVNLFKAYEMVKDEPFKAYIQRIHDGHNDGTAEVDGPTLLQKAVTYYKTAITNNKWEEPSATDKQVLALEAKVDGLQKKNKNLKEPKAKKPPVSNPKKRNVKKPRPNWLANHEPPKDKSKLFRFREWNNIKWYWCSPETKGKCKGNWRMHPPKDCQGTAKDSQEKKKVKFSGQKRKADALKVSAANAAVAADAEMEQEDSDYE
jgi:hypothetical protein